MADDDVSVLSVMEDMVIGRNTFLSGVNIRNIPVQQRTGIMSRYLTNEAMIIEFMNRVYTNNLQTQAAAAALVTLTMPALTGSFLDPVTVTASPAQINASLENYPNTTSNCAICQDAISSGGCRIRQCGHVYHRSCIENWLSMSVRCPVCRHDIREVNQANQTSAAEAETPSPQGDQ